MTHLNYCKPCRKLLIDVNLLECPCGHRMCKECWSEYDNICPMCETDYNVPTEQ